MLVQHAETLEKLTDIDELWHGVVQTLEPVGFDHVIYLTVNDHFDTPFLRTTMDGLYDRLQPQDDPFLHHACHSYTVVQIGSEFVQKHPHITAAERDFVARAGRSGFLSGFGIPTRLKGSDRFGGFILGTGLDRATFVKRISPFAEEVQLFCVLIHRRIEELSALPPSPHAQIQPSPDAPQTLPDRFEHLTPREREVVILLAQGCSRKQAAEICGISVHTVSDYAKMGYRKLGVHNRAQAAALLHDRSD